MTIGAVQIRALEAFGYTEQEASFLCTVATHSGYFTARHFLAFTGARSGKRTTVFWRKLRTKKHAHTHFLPGGHAVRHLFARQLYRQIGCDTPGLHRRHELEYIRTRLAVLDFVLAYPSLRYLETEDDKVSFFCGALKIEARHLPSRTYPGGSGVEPTIRYFADRFPLFVREPDSSPHTVTFSFLQGSEANLSAFARHLRGYSPLFRELGEFRFLYLARIDAQFAKARDLFRALVTVPLERNPADDLLRYFAIRKAWDFHEFSSLGEEDLVFRNVSRERFAGERFEHFYRSWKAGRIPEPEIRATFQGHHLPHVIHFEAQVLEPLRIRGEAGEARQRNTGSGAPDFPEGDDRVSKSNRTGGKIMSIIKKAPSLLTREFQLEEPVSLLLDDYAQFIESTADHVLNSAIKKTLWRDQDYRKWREQKRSAEYDALKRGPETAANS